MSLSAQNRISTWKGEVKESSRKRSIEVRQEGVPGLSIAVEDKRVISPSAELTDSQLNIALIPGTTW